MWSLKGASLVTAPPACQRVRHIGAIVIANHQVNALIEFALRPPPLDRPAFASQVAQLSGNRRIGRRFEHHRYHVIVWRDVVREDLDALRKIGGIDRDFPAKIRPRAA